MKQFKFKPDWVADGLLLAGEYAMRYEGALVVAHKADGWSNCYARRPDAQGGTMRCCFSKWGDITYLAGRCAGSSSCFRESRNDGTDIIWRPAHELRIQT